MIRSGWVGVVAILAALTSGCGTSRSAEGRMPPGNDMRTTTTETTVQARPQVIRLENKDPCALVPKNDWAKFFINKPGKPKQAETLNSPMCFYDNKKGIFDITLVTNEGIDAWRSGDRAAQPSETDPVRGFTAISLLQPLNKTACDVAVDVADGQYLLATVNISPAEVSTVPERCAYAHQLADSAMSTLVA